VSKKIEPNLSVNLAGIKLKTPIVAASGPFGYGREYNERSDFHYLGALTVKGVSLDPWQGNKPPRIAETTGGMLNAIGLQNPGLEYFLSEELPFLKKLDTRLIVNIIGRTIEEYSTVAGKLDQAPGIDGLEINISCPNVSCGGITLGTDPVLTAEVVGAVREKTILPILVKLSPNVTDITKIALAAEKAGADGISLINTVTGMLIDTKKKKPLLGNTFGGLSGPAVMPLALRMVWQVAETVNIPILGMGGINSADDALQFILAGARAVAIGTGIFYDPHLPVTILSGMRSYMIEGGYASLGQLEGAARKESY